MTLFAFEQGLIVESLAHYNDPSLDLKDYYRNPAANDESQTGGKSWGESVSRRSLSLV
jgi:hypothetical protein